MKIDIKMYSEEILEKAINNVKQTIELSAKQIKEIHYIYKNILDKT